MRCLLLALLTASVWLPHAAWSAAEARDLSSRKIPLTSIGLLADLDTPNYPDDPGTGGGFETGSYFQSRLVGARAVQTCMTQIESAVTAWATDLGLTRNLRDVTPVTLTIHYSKADLPGFFAVVYQIEQQVRARVRVDYYTLDGTLRSPELARELLQTYKIAAFESALDTALRCGEGS
jgi:hypothetical protein